MNRSHWILAIVTSVTLGIPGLAGLVFSSSAAAQDLDPGRLQTGPADCSRILWVGGYRQQDQGNCPKKARGYSDKDKKAKAREDQERFRQERKAKHDADKAKEKQAREDRKAKDADAKAKKCRGLGAPANCTEANPGHTGGSNGNPGKGKSKGKTKP